MKKKLSLFLAFVMVMGTLVLPMSAISTPVTVESGWNGSAASAPAGAGTANDPYLISSAEHLQWMSNLLNGKQFLATIGYNGQLWHPTYTQGWTELEAYEKGTTSFPVNGSTVNIDGVPKTATLSELANAPKPYFVQTCDIDLNGKVLETIGAYWRYDGNGTGCVKGHWFGGSYDGQGFSIQNGYIGPRQISAYAVTAGLFGNLWGATIKNLTFDNVHATGHSNMGLVAGNVIAPANFKNELDEETCFANQTTRIENVQVKDTCTVTHTTHANMATVVAYVGGLVGNAAYNTNFMRCRNDADISFGMYSLGVGGIAGKMMKNCRAEFCVNTGDLTPVGGKLPDQAAYGGILGTWQNDGTTGYHGKNAVINCLNTGSLKKSASAITGGSGTVISFGGIVGRTLSLYAAADANGNATEWKFENNINLGASPTLHESNSGYAAPRAAAGVGSLWHGDSHYDPDKGLTGTNVVLVAKNCYTVDTFRGLAGYTLSPSASCPILSTRVYTASPCGRTENCAALTKAEIEALPLYQMIAASVGSSSASHKLLGVQSRSEENGSYTVRFLFGIDSLDYQSYSYELMVGLGGKQGSRVYTDKVAYSSFLANGKAVYATDLGYTYLTAFTVKGMAADAEYTLGVTASALPTRAGNHPENTVKGDSVGVKVKNGQITYVDMKGHSVKIDGTDIGEFVIVMPQNAEITDQVTATTLQEHLYLTTGHKLSIVTDATAAAAHEIRIGNTNRSTAIALNTAQYAVIPQNGHLEIAYADSVALTALLEKLTDLYFKKNANDINLTLNGDTVMIQSYHPTLGKLSAPKVETAHAEKYAARTLYALDDSVSSKLKVTGRSVETAMGITLDWSASTVEFNADCEGDVKITLNTSHAIRFLVLVDGVQADILTTGSGTKTYTVASGLKAGSHNVRLVRTTKVEYNNVGALAEIQSLILNGSLKDRPADKKYLIEFVGDSVTTGVGAGSNTDPEAYAEHTYAYQTAQTLGTDLSVVAIPGIGTLTSTDRHKGLHIYTAYQYANYYRSAASKYTPDRQADLVVFATNANDNNGADQTAFKARVREMVEQAKAFHGSDTKFIWVFNMYATKNTINGYVREVFAEYGGESKGFYTLDFYQDNSGGDVHPSGAAHDGYTDLLVNFIKQKNILP